MKVKDNWTGTTTLSARTGKLTENAVFNVEQMRGATHGMGEMRTNELPIVKLLNEQLKTFANARPWGSQDVGDVDGAMF